MPDIRLTAETSALLAEAELSYPEVGRTRGELPTGYHHVQREAVIGHGRADFDAARAGLLAWRVQRGAGVRVLASTATIEPGSEAILLLGIGRLALRAPVRVVYVIDEPTRCAFAYGTLPGHPESGEEAFDVELRGDGSVVMTIRAFSNAATWLTQWSGPLGRLGQQLMIGRYLRTLRQ